MKKTGCRWEASWAVGGAAWGGGGGMVVVVVVVVAITFVFPLSFFIGVVRASRAELGWFVEITRRSWGRREGEDRLCLLF